MNKLIKSLGIGLLVSLGLADARAQEKNNYFDKGDFKTLSVGVRGLHLYDLPSFRFDGPLSRDMQGLNGGNTRFDLGLDIYVEKMLTPLLGLQLTYRNAGITGANEVEYYEGRFSEFALDAVFNLSNLDPLRVDNPWNIYVKAGAGVGNFSAEQFLIQDDAPDDQFEDSFWEGHFGLGVNYELNNRFRLELESMYNVAYNDGFDGFDGSTGSDPYITTALGLAYTIGSPEKKPLYAVNYFGEGYLNLHAATPPSTPLPMASPVTDTITPLRVKALQREVDSLSQILSATVSQIEKEEAATPEPEVQMEELAIYFTSNSSILSRDAKKQLLAEFESFENKNFKINITGFADIYGTENYNSGLRQRRTQAVKKFLVKLGFDPNAFQLNEGKELELGPGDQFLNRRVLIKYEEQ